MAAAPNDEVVLVAGGTGALGAAITRAFVAAGARVGVTYRQRTEFDALVAELGDAARQVEGLEVDVSDPAAVRRVVDDFTARRGAIVALVNAVGGYVGGVALWDTDAATLERMLALNLRALHSLVRAVVPAMRAARRGAIVNVAAKAGIEPGAGAAAYAASKAAAIAMLGSLAADLAGSGVRANSVLPSIIDTPANRRAMPDADTSRWVAPEAIAEVVRFLCSPAAAAIHGAAIPVYGNR
jgi:NAD(P)-dependent dehydrogenase (short-subunit alcohol dehydrogenase family)